MKLFNREDFNISVEEKITIDSKLNDNSQSNIALTIDEYKEDLQMALEGTIKAFNELYLVKDIKTSLESKKLASVDYFISIENYNLYLRSIANNLGIKAKIPSIEDFKNPYGIQTSHEIVIEGFTDFIKSIWEKIKEFFRAFFKKIMLFLKRLANSDLELDEYEKYIDSLISNIKKSKKTKTDIRIIETKLPVLLANPNMDEVDSHYILTKGAAKLNNLLQFNKNELNDGIKYLTKLVKAFEEDIEKLLKENNIKEIQEIIKNYKDLLIIKIFPYETNSLPDKVFSEIYEVFDDKESLSYYTLLANKDFEISLPKNFNIYCIVNNDNGNNDSKFYITSDIEANTYIKKELATIENSDSLIKFYEFYKKFSKEFNVKSVSDEFSKLGNEINRLNNKLSSLFQKTFNELGVIGENYFISIESNSNTNTKNDNNNNEVDYNIIDNTDEFLDSKESNQDNVQSSLIKNTIDKSEEIKELEKLQKFIFTYLNSIQKLIKEISINLIGTYQECKYELVRYIYISAKQF